jgi:hypothetical protein
MTEAEWLACADLTPMLEFLEGKACDRKLRLTLCGWSRLNWKWIPEASRRAVEAADLFADGLASDVERRDADAKVWWDTAGIKNTFRLWQARLTLSEDVDLWPAVRSAASRNPRCKSSQVALFRDIFGNPFRPPPAIPSSVLAWNGATVRRLAEAVYEDRQLPGGTLDAARLAILGDALLDAGCDNEALIQHCHEQGPHVRGCWAVDLILGKN